MMSSHVSYDFAMHAVFDKCLVKMQVTDVTHTHPTDALHCTSVCLLWFSYVVCVYFDLLQHSRSDHVTSVHP